MAKPRTTAPTTDKPDIDDEPTTDAAPQASEGSNGQKEEATDELVTFEWDGEEWTVRPSASRSLKFLAGLTDAEDGNAAGMVRALRVLLGDDDADRLFDKLDRDFSAGWSFLRAAGKAARTGNS